MLEEDSVQLQKRQTWLSLAAVAATGPGLVRLELLLMVDPGGQRGNSGKLAAADSASPSTRECLGTGFEAASGHVSICQRRRSLATVACPSCSCGDCRVGLDGTEADDETAAAAALYVC